MDRLVAIMRRLRDPRHGCEWDIAQTFQSIAPYTIEEAYEVADACRRGDIPALLGELGDLQLQVVFHTAIAEQSDLFTLRDVMSAICDKLERRHPHIFADGESPGWEAIKAAERGELADTSALADVPLALPALMRAQKLQSRAARIGFDWPDARGAREKVAEELDEFDAASGDSARAEELGDLLFSVVNLARKHGIDGEAALRSASAKFEARFRCMEALDPGLAERGPEDQEQRWIEAKRELTQPPRD